MRSPELEQVNTFVTSAALALMRGDPFLFFEKPPCFEIPCLPSTYSSDLFRSTSFSCVEKHLNEQGFLFLGFTWDLVQFLLYSRGIKRGKQKLSLNGRVALCWYRVKHPDLISWCPTHRANLDSLLAILDRATSEPRLWLRLLPLDTVNKKYFLRWVLISPLLKGHQLIFPVTSRTLTPEVLRSAQNKLPVFTVQKYQHQVGQRTHTDQTCLFCLILGSSLLFLQRHLPLLFFLNH